MNTNHQTRDEIQNDWTGHLRRRVERIDETFRSIVKEQCNMSKLFRKRQAYHSQFVRAYTINKQMFLNLEKKILKLRLVEERLSPSRGG
jgi:hypothetical protein